VILSGGHRGTDGSTSLCDRSTARPIGKDNFPLWDFSGGK
jgi:hypothetical protein